MKLSNIIGSSILTEGVNTALKIDKKVREFEALKHDRKREENEEILKEIVNDYEELRTLVLNKFAKKIQNALPKQRSSLEFEFKYNKKKVSSIIDKVIDRGKNLIEVPDLVRGATIFKHKDEMEAFVKNMNRKGSDIVEYEYKERGGDKKFGYWGTHHFDFKIDGLLVELQVSTRKLWNYKRVGHEIYKKWRSSDTKPDPFDIHRSKKIFDMGNLSEVEDEVEDDESVGTENVQTILSNGEESFSIDKYIE